MRGVNLVNGCLQQADLGNCNLSGADLTNADLEEAILMGAILHGANFTQANLLCAIIGHQALQNAITLGVCIQGINLD